MSVVSTITNGIKDVTGKVFNFIRGKHDAKYGNKARQDELSAKNSQQVMKSYSAEFGNTKNWWDSLWNGINRMPRPLFVITIYLYLICSWRNPEQFAKINTGLDLIPAEMWWIIAAIITFYFGGRFADKITESKINQQIISKPLPEIEITNKPIKKIKKRLKK